MSDWKEKERGEGRDEKQNSFSAWETQILGASSATFPANLQTVKLTWSETKIQV